MKYLCIIKDISLCSTNNKYLSGRFILTNKYKTCSEKLIEAFMYAKPDKFETIDCECKVTLLIDMYADIDNYSKVILDCLQKAEVIKNDREVMELNIVKTRIKRGRPNNLQVSIM